MQWFKLPEYIVNLIFIMYIKNVFLDYLLIFRMKLKNNSDTDITRF